VTEEPPAGLADVPVFLGGPVGKNQLMFAAFEWHQSGGLKLNHNVGFNETSEAAGHKKIITVCAFVGYAGWGAGQLESEMKQKAWLLQKPIPRCSSLIAFRTCGSRSCENLGRGIKCSLRRQTIRH